jgi:hypothetical protein
VTRPSRLETADTTHVKAGAGSVPSPRLPFGILMVQGALHCDASPSSPGQFFRFAIRNRGRQAGLVRLVRLLRVSSWCGWGAMREKRELNNQPLSPMRVGKRHSQIKRSN